jgi:rhodanese-related sulfurtransferase
MIIDVRDKNEYENGHIEGSLNISLTDIMSGVLPDCEKDTPIVLYCASGGRSEYAKNILFSAGFTNVENGGGWRDMKAKGY